MFREAEILLAGSETAKSKVSEALRAEPANWDWS